jgi:hypothetical protein
VTLLIAGAMVNGTSFAMSVVSPIADMPLRRKRRNAPTADKNMARGIVLIDRGEAITGSCDGNADSLWLLSAGVRSNRHEDASCRARER